MILSRLLLLTSLIILETFSDDFSNPELARYNDKLKVIYGRLVEEGCLNKTATGKTRRSLIGIDKSDDKLDIQRKYERLFDQLVTCRKKKLEKNTVLSTARIPATNTTTAKTATTATTITTTTTTATNPKTSTAPTTTTKTTTTPTTTNPSSKTTHQITTKAETATTTTTATALKTTTNPTPTTAPTTKTVPTTKTATTSTAIPIITTTPAITAKPTTKTPTATTSSTNNTSIMTTKIQTATAPTTIRTTTTTTNSTATTTHSTFTQIPIPTDCLNAINLTESWRTEHNGGDIRPKNERWNCDLREMVKAGRPWFRFSGAAGNRLLNMCVPSMSCGTAGVLWSDDLTPSSIGVVSQITAYGNIYYREWITDARCREFQRKLSIMRCSDKAHDFVYRYDDADYCYRGFCGMFA